jgi:hypothetical protein
MPEFPDNVNEKAVLATVFITWLIPFSSVEGVLLSILFCRTSLLKHFLNIVRDFSRLLIQVLVVYLRLRVHVSIGGFKTSLEQLQKQKEAE